VVSAICKHIKVLERAGLVSRGHRAQYRPCTLEAAPWRSSLTGPSSTDRYGKPASAAWTNTSPNSDDSEKRKHTITDQTQLDAVVIERTFDVSGDLIWQMWTQPEHFKAWYGPDGAAIPVASTGEGGWAMALDKLAAHVEAHSIQ
jgi:hypothetical protein